MLDPSKVQVIAFDLANTAFDVSFAPDGERRDYVDTFLHRPWCPQDALSEWWTRMPAFPGVAEGIDRLRHKFTAVTCSNLPVPIQKSASDYAGVRWDHYIDLAELKSYKPDPACYAFVASYLSVKRENVLFVTANPVLGDYGFGDCEIARLLGMQAVLIRQRHKDGTPVEGSPQTLIELAELLGA
jgi:HAD superfamily hydrolase (TIGR01493 family)